MHPLAWDAIQKIQKQQAGAGAAAHTLILYGVYEWLAALFLCKACPPVRRFCVRGV